MFVKRFYRMFVLSTVGGFLDSCNDQCLYVIRIQRGGLNAVPPIGRGKQGRLAFFPRGWQASINWDASERSISFHVLP